MLDLACNTVTPAAQFAVRDEWNTLDQLRDLAMARGFSAEQFDMAVEATGADPSLVADYLHRWGLLSWMHNRGESSA